LLATVINGIMLLLQIFAVFLGGGVIALASIATAGALAQRMVTRRFTYRSKPELFAVRGAWNPEVLRGVPALAIRAWLSSLGTVLVFHTDGFFIASAAGAENIPAFRAAFLVVLNMHVIASVFAQSSSVFISQLWQAGQRDEVRRIFQRNLRIGLCVMLCGGAAVLVAGESLFKVWLGPSNYVGTGILSLFVFLFVLEQQSFIISTSCRATDHEPFAGWMMAGGLIKMLLAFFLIKHLGLFGLALATLVAQLFTAHWFVVWRGLQRLQFGFRRYMLAVVTPVLVVTLAALAMAGLGGYLSRNCSDWARLLGVSSGAGAVLFVALWFLAMDDGQRTRILGWISVRKANRAISFL
jgi:O-antigen/teichoic acid export membrane protein